MEERDVFNQRVKSTVAYALMLFGLYFIIAAINGFFTANWEVGSLFGILGLVMIILGYMFTKPRLSWLHLIGFMLIGSGIWISFRSVSNAVDIISDNNGDNNAIWLWGAVALACLLSGWILMSTLLNNQNRRIGTLLMISSGLIFAVSVNLTAVQGLISLIILLTSVIIFAQGYKTFIKKA